LKNLSTPLNTCTSNLCVRSSGQVAVMEMNIERRSKPERVRQTADHLGSKVTTMVWDSAGSSLFVGDDAGKLTHVNIPSSRVSVMFLLLVGCLDMHLHVYSQPA
jgi:hypothetical protein